MPSRTNDWRGCCQDWQPQFIREYLLPLGHAAWQGLLAQGRGLVACEVGILAPPLDWRASAVNYTIRYLNDSNLEGYLRSHNLPSDVITQLQRTVQSYRPEHELLLALSRDGDLTVNHLCRLAIAPPDCYRQLENRRAEFPLNSISL